MYEVLVRLALFTISAMVSFTVIFWLVIAILALVSP
jgi:hypothetical protein